MFRRHKYKATRIEVDGIKFPSKKQAKDYLKLKARLELGEISDLRHEVSFPLHGPKGTKIGSYRADFVYNEGELKVIHESKGYPTDLFKWKWKHVQDEYGHEYELRIT